MTSLAPIEGVIVSCQYFLISSQSDGNEIVASYVILLELSIDLCSFRAPTLRHVQILHLQMIMAAPQNKMLQTPRGSCALPVMYMRIILGTGRFPIALHWRLFLLFKQVVTNIGVSHQCIP